jgi:hypothetical protein
MFRLFLKVVSFVASMPILGTLLISIFGSGSASAANESSNFLQLNNDANHVASYSSHGSHSSSHGSHSSSHGSHSSSHGSHSSSHGSHSSSHGSHGSHASGY